MYTKALTILAVLLAATQPAVAQQASTQQARETRQQVEERLRELRNELRELERRLNDINRQEGRARVVTPRAWSSGPLVRVMTNRAMLGVTVRTDQNPRVDSIGAELSGVTPGGPADRAGLRSGDIITTFNNERLAGRYPAAGEDESEPGMKLVHFARDLEDGDTVEVEYRRGSASHKTTIVAREMDADDWFGYVTVEPPEVRIEADRLREMARGMAGQNWAFSFSDRLLDMDLVSLNAELGEYFGTTDGLLVVRAPQEGSLNLKAGDVILRIGGRTPTSQASVARILRSYDEGETVEIEIMRQKRRMTVTGTIPERDGYFDEDWDQETRR